MPNCLKTIFYPSSCRFPSHHPELLPPSEAPIAYSPISPHTEERTLQNVSTFLADQPLRSNEVEHGAMEQILEVLRGIREERVQRRVSPYHDPGTVTSEDQHSGFVKPAVAPDLHKALPPPPPPIGSTASPTPDAKDEIPHDEPFEQLDVAALQARFGNGPTPPSRLPTRSATPAPTSPPSASTSAQSSTSSSPRVRSPAGPAVPNALIAPPSGASPAPDPPASPTPSPKSIWEYCGHHLTRSALDLTLRQEALAQADSSGQYAGEVHWDEVRDAWIPIWARPLRREEVAEGEVPSTDPADYTMVQQDAWGNRVGWYGGRLYHGDDPVFQL